MIVLIFFIFYFSFFLQQEASLCAQHAVNMLLQGSYFTAADLAEIASDIDNREGRVLNEQDVMSHNVDDSGFFSLQVSKLHFFHVLKFFFS